MRSAAVHESVCPAGRCIFTAPRRRSPKAANPKRTESAGQEASSDGEDHRMRNPSVEEDPRRKSAEEDFRRYSEEKFLGGRSAGEISGEGRRKNLRTPCGGDEPPALSPKKGKTTRKRRKDAIFSVFHYNGRIENCQGKNKIFYKNSA